MISARVDTGQLLMEALPHAILHLVAGALQCVYRLLQSQARKVSSTYITSIPIDMFVGLSHF